MIWDILLICMGCVVGLFIVFGLVIDIINGLKKGKNNDANTQEE